MSCCSSCNFDPCRCGCGFTDPSLPGFDAGRTLMQSLVPCVDGIRDLYTCLGTRSYVVVLVRTKWSGGERGTGVEEIVSEETILPVPRVGPVSSMNRVNEPVGLLEQGELKVDQISARYTEDHLLGMPVDGSKMPYDENFYWELRVIPADGSPQVRRRFFPKGVPNLDMMQVQWSVQIERASQDRGRGGDPRG